MTNETRSDTASIEEIVQHVMRAYAAAQGLRAGGFLVSEIAERVYARIPGVPAAAREAFGEMITAEWGSVEAVLSLTDDAIRGKTQDEVVASARARVEAFMAREGGSADAATALGRNAAFARMTDSEPTSSVFAAVDKLLAEMTSPFPNQTPAAECVIVLRSGKEFAGSLSKHEGGLRMMVPANMTPGKVTMLEVFFDYDDVAAVAVRRDIVAAAPRIVI